MKPARWLKPLTTLTRRSGKRFPMRELLTLVEQHAVTGVVVGLRFDQEGAEAEAATAARALAADIARHSGKPVELWDERLTTAARAPGGARDGGLHQGPEGRRGRARGGGAVASTSSMPSGGRRYECPGLLLVALVACSSPDGPRVTVTIPAGATLDAAVDSSPPPT